MGYDEIFRIFGIKNRTYALWKLPGIVKDVPRGPSVNFGPDQVSNFRAFRCRKNVHIILGCLPLWDHLYRHEKS